MIALFLIIFLAAAFTPLRASVLPQSLGPRVVFETPPWWESYLPVLFSFVQFLLLSGITIFVFWSNASQKIRERQAEWYHDVVVDHAIARLDVLFAEMQERLQQAADKVGELRNSDVEKARRYSLAAISQAKKTLFGLRSEMGFRVSTFDTNLEQLFTRRLEQLENEIVEWFTKQPEQHCYEASSSLPAILSRGQIALLRILMRKEFLTWGLDWPWSRRGTAPPSAE